MNLVEEFAEESEFDQPCKFGNRVETHSVYCHSEDPKAPRKCRRTWYTGGEVKDQDCPFLPNPDFKEVINKN